MIGGEVTSSLGQSRGLTLPALLVGMALSTGLIAALIDVSVQLIATSTRVAHKADFLATVAHSIGALAATARSLSVEESTSAGTDISLRPCEPGLHPVGVWVLSPREINCASGLPDAPTSSVLLSSQILPCEDSCAGVFQRRRLWYRRAYAWRPGDERGALMVKEFDRQGAYGRAEMMAAGLVAWVGSNIISAAGEEGVQLETDWRLEEGVFWDDEEDGLSLNLTLFPSALSDQ